MPVVKVLPMMTACALLCSAMAVNAQTNADIPVVPVSVVEDAHQKAKNATIDPTLAGTRPDQREKVKREAKKADTPSPVKAQKTQRATTKVVIDRGHEVQVIPGINKTIEIARNQPNRLVTPFKDPQVISTVLSMGKGDEAGEVTVRDNVVYVTTDKAVPVTIFITENGREDIAMSLTMIPALTTPKEVKLSLPEAIMAELKSAKAMYGVSGNATEALAWETSQPYVDMIRETFRAMALGEVPSGYTLRTIRMREAKPQCIQSGLRFSFVNGQVLEGHEMDYYVGVATNVSNEPIEFMEQRCGGWRVAAVTAFPLKVLKPGEQTEVYVAVKHEDKAPEQSVRRPLITRQLP